ncbi:hypothetical protein N9039_02530 [Verrucomicrobiales bacterium]|nr:hypothetical protein [Verrucomicrobiales bacterium]
MRKNLFKTSSRPSGPRASLTIVLDKQVIENVLSSPAGGIQRGPVPVILESMRLSDSGPNYAFKGQTPHC